jgi:hypothetical protein
MNRLALSLLLLLTCSAGAFAQGKTENVIFVMTDGLRWQEVFHGAEDTLLTKENGGVKNVDALRRAYAPSESLDTRRTALMPFFWSTLAKQGQVFGNQDKGSIAQVTNGKNFSYPGYSETLTGFADPRIDSNGKINNPNVTVLEWLNGKPRFKGKVAAFGAWDVFPFILNRDRAGFPVNAGFEPLTISKMSPKIELLNQLKAETPSTWDEEPYDAFTFHTALEYLKAEKPRVLYISLGETDEWAHGGKYDEYLTAAHRVDTYLKVLWDTLQSMPQYKGKTTLIFSPDHGRGDAPTGWRSHGAGVKGSENIWMAFLGPDTPALGEVTPNGGRVTQNQIAATLAALLGEDYNGAVPAAGKPVAGVISPGKK